VKTNVSRALIAVFVMTVSNAVVPHPTAQAASGGPALQQRGLMYNLQTGRIGAPAARLYLDATATPLDCGRIRIYVTRVVGTRPTTLHEWFLQVRGGSPKLHISDRAAYATAHILAGTEGHPGTLWAGMIFTSPTGQLTVTRTGRQVVQVTYPVLYSFTEVYHRHEGWSAGCVR